MPSGTKLKEMYCKCLKMFITSCENNTGCEHRTKTENKETNTNLNTKRMA